MPELSVIIVNYNTADHLGRCLTSVLAQTGIDLQVLVVDNASRDGSCALVQQRFPQVELIASPTNLGFARANNLAALQAKGRLLFLLNPDTEVRPGCLAALVDFLARHPEVGMVGSSILYPDGRPQESVETRYPGQRHTRGELSDLAGPIAWLLGASLMVRREAYTAVGGLAEDYFLYGEDIDLGLCLRRAGWQLGFCPGAVIVHWEGQSERQTPSPELRAKKLAAEALFYRRHYRPESVARICRANIRQARWRLLTLTLEKLWSRDAKVLAEKTARYRQVLSFFQAELAGLGRTRP